MRIAVVVVAAVQFGCSDRESHSVSVVPPNSSEGRPPTLQEQPGAVILGPPVIAVPRRSSVEPIRDHASIMLETERAAHVGVGFQSHVVLEHEVSHGSVASASTHGSSPVPERNDVGGNLVAGSHHTDRTGHSSSIANASAYSSVSAEGEDEPDSTQIVVDRASATRIAVDFESCAATAVDVPARNRRGNPIAIPACMPGTLTIDGEGISFRNQIGRGSRSVVYKSSNNRYVVKVISKLGGPIFSALCMERAVLSELGGLGGSTVRKFNFIAPQRQPPSCGPRMMVSDMVSGHTLFVANPPDHELFRIGAQLIRALKSLHMHGIVHGDIHGRNIIVDAAGLGRLIDFGNASFFVDPATGEHIPESRGIPDATLNPGFMSIFQLEGFPKTRRDDMVRLAEALLRMPERVNQFCDLNRLAALEGATGEETDDELVQMSRAYFARCKRNHSVVPDRPRLAQDFFEAMMQTPFSDAPDYEHWALLFEQAASTTSV